MGRYIGFEFNKDKRIYSIWYDIKRRCYDKKNKRYKNYGGRGIKLCNEWLDFQKFYDWAISNGYNNNLTIDRINNNGNYDPSNCRWATIKQQMNNTTKNHYITLTLSMAEWSELLNIPYTAIRQRQNLGWNEYDTLIKPIKGGGCSDK